MIQDVREPQAKQTHMLFLYHFSMWCRTALTPTPLTHDQTYHLSCFLSKVNDEATAIRMIHFNFITGGVKLNLEA